MASFIKHVDVKTPTAGRMVWSGLVSAADDVGHCW